MSMLATSPFNVFEVFSSPPADDSEVVTEPLMTSEGEWLIDFAGENLEVPA